MADLSLAMLSDLDAYAKKTDVVAVGSVTAAQVNGGLTTGRYWLPLGEASVLGLGSADHFVDVYRRPLTALELQVAIRYTDGVRRSRRRSSSSAEWSAWA